MSTTLSVLNPIIITTAKLTSSTVAETDYAAWSGATTYAQYARVINTTTHRIYESAVASNLNHDPTDINNRAGSVIYWNDIGATNKYKMFDTQNSSQTVVTSPLTVVLKPGASNAIYLAGLDATSMTITVKDSPGGAVLKTVTTALEGSAPDDYYEYFFDPFRPQSDYLLTGLEPYSTAETTITLTSPSPVKCGVVAMGDLKPLGQTLSGAKVKPKSYSYIKIDDYGDNEIRRRKSAKDITASAYLATSEVNNVVDVTTELLDVPCFWLCSDLQQYAGLRCFGLGTVEISYDSPSISNLTLSVNGLI